MWTVPYIYRDTGRFAVHITNGTYILVLCIDFNSMMEGNGLEHDSQMYLNQFKSNCWLAIQSQCMQYKYDLIYLKTWFFGDEEYRGDRSQSINILQSFS